MATGVTAAFTASWGSSRFSSANVARKNLCRESQCVLTCYRSVPCLQHFLRQINVAGAHKGAHVHRKTRRCVNEEAVWCQGSNACKAHPSLGR